MPQAVLEKYLKLFEAGDETGRHPKSIGIGMDSAVVPLKRHNLNLVQSVDFFYPLIDDPYLMGKIALANVVSDIYATGVATIDRLEMIISAPTEFTDAQRDVIVPLIIKGFKDAAAAANCTVHVPRITINPWCIIGGIASAVCHEKEIIFPNNARAGDALILTKPLGTQLATNALIWLKDKSSEWEKLLAAGVTEAEVCETFGRAVDSMAHLNRTAAQLMHKFQGHAATDVTGFGLLGHASNLASFQSQNLDFYIEILPVIRGVLKIAQTLGRTQKLLTGNAVETSGGLLIALPVENSKAFCKEYHAKTKFNAWLVGYVEEGTKQVQLREDVEILEV